MQNVQNLFRRKNFTKFLESRRGWIQNEMAALQTPLTEGAVCRVVIVRHGMARHNDVAGAATILHRDAPLNTVGREEATMTGTDLREGGFLALPCDLVVVSPFTRTLETAALLLGSDAGRIPCIITPLCAEHTWERSKYAMGDLGSPTVELRKRFPEETYPQYDFSTVDAYCEQTGCNAGRPPKEHGQWWHHGPGDFETAETFAARARRLRLWLARTCMDRGAIHALLVAHGGILTAAFGLPKMHNCEYRVFDLFEDGHCVRIGPTGAHHPFHHNRHSHHSGRGHHGSELLAPARAAPALPLLQLAEAKVVSAPERGFLLAGSIDDRPFETLLRFEDAAQLHSRATELLSPSEVSALLDGEPFPDRAAHDAETLVQHAAEHRVVTFLHHLCGRFNDRGFPAALAKALVKAILAGRSLTATEAQLDQAHPSVVDSVHAAAVPYAWYAGGASKNVCDALVSAAGDGAYLVRKSPAAGKFLFSFCSAGSATNLPVFVDASGQVTFGKAVYPTLEALVTTLAATTLRSKEGAVVKITHPVAVPDRLALVNATEPTLAAAMAVQNDVTTANTLNCTTPASSSTPSATGGSVDAVGSLGAHLERLLLRPSTDFEVDYDALRAAAGRGNTADSVFGHPDGDTGADSTSEGEDDSDSDSDGGGDIGLVRSPGPTDDGASWNPFG